MALRVVSAILFSPRGGSAHVARALVRGMRAQEYSVTLVAGSRSDLGRHGDARCFYGDVEAVKFDAALASGAPLSFEGPAGTAPLHPSFEERPDAPDRVFATLDDLDYDRQVRAWSHELARAGAREADVLHLHHLTPLNEAAARVAPHVPVVGQLHGTELLMLERIAAGAPPGWQHAAKWEGRMREWARRCARIVVAPAGVERALGLLGVPRERVIALPNGVDAELFAPREIDRLEFWRRALVEQPQGRLLDGRNRSAHYGEAEVARYGAAEVARLAGGTVLLHVGRFTAVKRLDRLIGAFAMAQEQLSRPAGLVLVGGYPGEWEGEHPAQIAARLQVPAVFLAGWQTHEQLPDFFSAADAVVTASEREQFGQVLIEGMACCLPAVAPRSFGPASIIDDRRTGWLVELDDDAALAAALKEVVEEPEERRRRGRAARLAVCERYTWSGVSGRLAAVFAEVAAGAQRAPAIEA